MTEAEKLEKELSERKEKILKEINELPLENWTPPKGLPIPYRDSVILLPIAQPDKKTINGIILPEEAAGDKANNRKSAIVARLGESVTLPIKIGSRVLFDQRAAAGAARINGQDSREYIVLLQHFIYAAITPETYIVPEFRTKMEKRNDERREGMIKVNKDEQNKLNMSKEEKEDLDRKTKKEV